MRILRPEEVNESHGLQIAEASLRYNIGHSDMYKDSDSRIVVEPDCDKKIVKVTADIKTISTDELFQELRRRGYTGTLNKSIVI